MPTQKLQIIGISTRTSNKDNRAEVAIGALWNRFYAEGILEKVSNKINNTVYSIYTDYESDYHGEYTVIIGILVSSLNEIPPGFIVRNFPEENFKKFTASGEMPNAVISCWMNIWQQNAELNRKYTYDFEEYDERSTRGHDSEVDIYISVKK